jgi:hypothetical protein
MRFSNETTSRLSRENPAAVSVVTLAILIMLPIPSKAQTVLPAKQAEQRAETLLGKKPDHVDMYLSQKENLEYFAFTVLTGAKWDEATKTQTPAQEEIWIYERARGSDDMRPVWEEHRLWPDMDPGAAVRYDPPAGFVEVSGQTSPCLRLKAYSGGMHAGTTRLGLYCVTERRLFWVDFFSDLGPSAQTGAQKVEVTDENAPQPQIRRSLLSWGHDLALDVPPSYPSIDAVRRLQQLWIDANGRKACSYEQTVPYRWKTWKTDQVDRLTPYTMRTLLKDPLVVLDDGRYQWLSYPGADAMANVGTALAGVGRYDKQLGRYDLVYVPDSSFDYSKELVVIGDWVYIQDCGERWAVRFNTVTRRLQRGEFDSIVGTLTTGIYSVSRPGQAAGEQASGQDELSHGFWVVADKPLFERSAYFSEDLRQRIIDGFKELQEMGMTCGGDAKSLWCRKGAEVIKFARYRVNRAEELSVVGAPAADGSDLFVVLCKAAMEMVGRSDWAAQIKPGMAKVDALYQIAKRKSPGESPFVGIRHVGTKIRSSLTAMDRKMVVLMVGAMGMFQQPSADSSGLPDVEYYLLSVNLRALTN